MSPDKLSSSRAWETLQPYLPLLFTEMSEGRVPEVVHQIWAEIKKKVLQHPDLSEALDDIVANPYDTDAQETFRVAVKKLLREDKELVAQINKILSITPGSIVNTGGGAYIGGSVSTGGGDFVGRDRVVTVGSRGVAIRGNVSGSTILVGDGNIVNLHQNPTKQLLSAIEQIEKIVDSADIQEEDKEEILYDVRRVQSLLSSTPVNSRIIIKRLSSLVNFVTEISDVKLQKQVIPRARRALLIAQDVLE